MDPALSASLSEGQLAVRLRFRSIPDRREKSVSLISGDGIREP